MHYLGEEHFKEREHQTSKPRGRGVLGILEEQRSVWLEKEKGRVVGGGVRSREGLITFGLIGY